VPKLVIKTCIPLSYTTIPSTLLNFSSRRCWHLPIFNFSFTSFLFIRLTHELKDKIEDHLHVRSHSPTRRTRDSTRPTHKKPDLYSLYSPPCTQNKLLGLVFFYKNWWIDIFWIIFTLFLCFHHNFLYFRFYLLGFSVTLVSYLISDRGLLWLSFYSLCLKLHLFYNIICETGRFCFIPRNLQVIYRYNYLFLRCLTVYGPLQNPHNIQNTNLLTHNPLKNYLTSAIMNLCLDILTFFISCILESIRLPA